MKQLKTALLVIAMVLFCAVSSYAVPIASSTATLIGHGLGGGTGGGEFLFQSNGKTYITFCVEENEYIAYNHTYFIDSIEDYAIKGGKGYADAAIGEEAGYSTSTIDYINSATVWLFWAYFHDTTLLGTTNPHYRDNILANRVQKTIWYLENEITSLDSDTLGFYTNYVANNSTQTGRYDITGNPIKVMNLTYTNSNGTVLHQSQLVGDPAPEPGTLLLFGLGFLGVAVGTRRKFFKK